MKLKIVASIGPWAPSRENVRFAPSREGRTTSGARPPRRDTQLPGTGARPPAHPCQEGEVRRRRGERARDASGGEGRRVACCVGTSTTRRASVCGVGKKEKLGKIEEIKREGYYSHFKVYELFCLAWEAILSKRFIKTAPALTVELFKELKQKTAPLLKWRRVKRGLNPTRAN